MHVVGSVIMLMHIDNDDTPKELDHGLLHLSGSSYEEVCLTTYYLFICSHTFNTIFVVCYISCNLRAFVFILEWRTKFLRVKQVSIYLDFNDGRIFGAMR